MKTETSATQAESRFKVVLDTVSDGVTVLDPDLRIQFQNRSISQWFGSRIGEYCFEAYRGRQSPCEDCLVAEVLRDGKSRTGIRDVALPNGGVVLIEFSSAALKNEDGKIIGAVEVARDVTPQKKAEAMLNRTLLERNQVLRRLNEELSDAAGYVKTVLPPPITSGPLRTDWRFIPSASLGGDSFGYHWIDEDHFAMYRSTSAGTAGPRPCSPFDYQCLALPSPAPNRFPESQQVYLR
jgi:PAS domain S-box-containing protein